MKKRFLFEKLGRDNIVDILTKNGIESHWRTLSHTEHLDALKLKLIEEAEEVAAAEYGDEIVEELADLQEVISVLMDKLQIDQASIDKSRAKKKSERGGFSKGIYVAYADIPVDSSEIDYFLQQPKRYPVVPIE